MSWIEGRPNDLPKQVQTRSSASAGTDPENNSDRSVAATLVQKAGSQANILPTNATDGHVGRQLQVATGDLTTPSVLGPRNRSSEPGAAGDPNEPPSKKWKAALGAEK